MKKRAAPPKLTEAEWAQVFKLRCKSKQGQRLDPTEQQLTDRAWREDPDRYSAMAPDVFDATVPFGSNVRWPRKQS